MLITIVEMITIYADADIEDQSAVFQIHSFNIDWYFRFHIRKSHKSQTWIIQSFVAQNLFLMLNCKHQNNHE